ncbi:MAG: hypothetical protein QM765_34670 [Myxococcales bacterium]
MSLSQIRTKLESLVGPASSIPFWAINTRLVLRTGVDLRNIRAEQDKKPELEAEVRKALADLGYSV